MTIAQKFINQTSNEDTIAFGATTPEDRKAERHARCGKEYNGSGLKGQLGEHIYFCDDWRNCKRCAKRRIYKNRKLFGRYFEQEETICVLHTTAKDFRKWCKKNPDKSLYRRYPQGDGLVTVFLHPSTNLGTKYQKLYILNWLNLDNIIMGVPDGERITGDLGKEIEEPSLGVIEMPVVNITNTDDVSGQQLRKVKIACFDQAIVQTSSENPQTIEELQRSIIRRTSAYAYQLQLRGYELEFITYRKTVRSIPDWSEVTHNCLVASNQSSSWLPKKEVAQLNN